LQNHGQAPVYTASGVATNKALGRPAYNQSANRGSAPSQKFTYQNKVQRGAGYNNGGERGSAVARHFSNGKPYFMRNGEQLATRDRNGNNLP